MSENEGESRDSLIVDVSHMTLSELNASRHPALLQCIELIREEAEKIRPSLIWMSRI